MNKENIQKAINVMKRVKARGDNLYMPEWQHGGGYPLKTEAELHECGTAACFGGWLAVSPEWQQDGGSVGTFAQPCMDDQPANKSIAQWLGISNDEARGLMGLALNDRPNDYYGKPLSLVTVDDVIDKLQELLNDEH